MKNRFNIILVLAIIFGIMAAWGTYQYLEHLKKTYKASGKFITVAVAREKIPARTAITEQLVEFSEIPSNYINADAITEKDEVINRLSKGDIYPGEQILKSKIIAQGDPSGGVAMMIEPGRRAAAIEVDPVAGVAGVLKPGDRVDALVVVDVPGQTKTTVASTYIQNIRVLSVNRTVGSGKDTGQPSNQLITMSLNPLEAQQLALASSRGTMRLILRTPGDQSVTAISSSQINNLVR
jgi:pilus assembly protein CpaB